MYDAYAKSGHAIILQRFWHKFPDVTHPNREPIHTIVNK
jgi:hypothetical protein